MVLNSAKLVWIGKVCAAVGLVALLLSDTELALSSASDGLAMWWERVLPGLFPFYVAVSILFRLGAFRKLAQLTASPLPACFLFGVLGGYPTGARLAGLMGVPGLGNGTNVCGVMFLKSVVASGMFHAPGLFWPVALAHYGTALLFAFFRRGEVQVTHPVNEGKNEVGSLFADIGEGMLVMLRIGGCMVFFTVCSSLLTEAFLKSASPLTKAILAGVTEMTKGCRDLSMLHLSPRLQAGLTAAILSFGGVCVLAQAKLVSPELSMPSYFFSKLAQGCLAGITAYAISPWFLMETLPAMADRYGDYVDNALTGAAFLVCCGMGLGAAFLFGGVVSAGGEGKSFPP